MTITTTKEELVMLIEQGIVDEHVYEMKVREYMNAAFLYPFVKTPDSTPPVAPAPPNINQLVERFTKNE